ncbi:hypothetical protein [Methylomonas sp. AM2-LC]|uniref:hypothetical protein n=1 Tax=Methylomonas sp. AM2-LC TaxID=3153301 RepID=UPI003262CE05
MENLILNRLLQANQLEEALKKIWEKIDRNNYGYFIDSNCYYEESLKNRFFSYSQEDNQYNFDLAEEFKKIVDQNTKLIEALQIFVGEDVLTSPYTHECADLLGREKGTWGESAEITSRNIIESSISEIICIASETAQRNNFQNRVYDWLKACFGKEKTSDKSQRNFRFLEESLELVQSTGCTSREAHMLVDYVYNRPVGEPSQECGGVMITLAGLCIANELDMSKCGETELARVWNKIDQIRDKEAAKPEKTPLPEHVLPIAIDTIDTILKGDKEQGKIIIQNLIDDRDNRIKQLEAELIKALEH